MPNQNDNDDAPGLHANLSVGPVEVSAGSGGLRIDIPEVGAQVDSFTMASWSAYRPSSFVG